MPWLMSVSRTFSHDVAIFLQHGKGALHAVFPFARMRPFDEMGFFFAWEYCKDEFLAVTMG
jgi:hypothetical protein